MVKILCPECEKEYNLQNPLEEHPDYRCPECKKLSEQGPQEQIVKGVIVTSCQDCPHRRYTESSDYCKEMPMGKDKGDPVWRQLTDLSIIHELCPLKNLKDLIPGGDQN